MAIILLEETEILSETAWQHNYTDEHLQFNHKNMDARPNIEVIWFELKPNKKQENLVWQSLQTTKFCCFCFMARGRINLSDLFEG